MAGQTRPAALNAAPGPRVAGGMDPFPPRLGYCCMFRAPDADPLQERRFNVSGTTVTALQRMDRLDEF